MESTRIGLLNELLSELTQDPLSTSEMRDGAILLQNDIASLVAEAADRAELQGAANRSAPGDGSSWMAADGQSPVVDVPPVVEAEAPAPAEEQGPQRLADLHPLPRQLCETALEIEGVLREMLKQQAASASAVDKKLVLSGARIVDSLRTLIFEHLQDGHDPRLATAGADLVKWFNQLAREA